VGYDPGPPSQQLVLQMMKFGSKIEKGIIVSVCVSSSIVSNGFVVEYL
jgi:hypothetical protein